MTSADVAAWVTAIGTVIIGGGVVFGGAMSSRRQTRS